MKTARNIKIALKIQEKLIGTRIGIKTLSKNLCIEEERIKQILKGTIDLSYNEVVLLCVYLCITPNELFGYEQIDIEKTLRTIWNEKTNQENLIKYKTEETEDLNLFDNVFERVLNNNNKN